MECIITSLGWSEHESPKSHHFENPSFCNGILKSQNNHKDVLLFWLFSQSPYSFCCTELPIAIIRYHIKLYIQSAILFHKTTWPHLSAFTKEKKFKTYWKILKNPPNSSKLSPCGFLFGPLNEDLGGYHFNDDKGVKRSCVIGYWYDKLHSLMRNGKMH